MPWRTDSVSLTFCLGLLFLAGWVDAVAFLGWQGYYVSFMSGNTTQMALASAARMWAHVAAAGSVVASFVAGVILGEWVGAMRIHDRCAAVLGTESLLLAIAAILFASGGEGAAIRTLLAIAMGLQNAAIRLVHPLGGAPTYVTGTLVHLGQSIAAALMGRGPWLPARIYLGMWLGLLAGAVAGALVASLDAAGSLVLVIPLGMAATLAFLSRHP